MNFKKTINNIFDYKNKINSWIDLMKYLLTLKDLSKEEIIELIKLGIEVKKNPQKYCDKLKNKSLAMIFQKTSTRTRVSFEVGMHQLGGHAIFIDWMTTNFLRGVIIDEIQCISRYVDCIMARVFKHSDLELMAKYSRVPVINGLYDMFHPCQALGDLMTIYEKFKDPYSIEIAFVGDGANNVASSLTICCAKLGINLNIAAPLNYSLRNDVKEYLKSNNLEHYVKEYKSPLEATKNSDVIYTDTWISMGQESESEVRMKLFQDYQVNMNLIKNSNKSPVVMHCLPAHREYEITSEVLDSQYSIVFDQAENRMHIQKAILLKLLCDEFK